MKNIAIYIALFAACLVVVDATTTVVALKYKADQNPGGDNNCTTKATTGDISVTYTMADAGTFCNQFTTQTVGVTPDVVNSYRKWVCNGTDTVNLNVYAASDTTCSGTYSVYPITVANWTTILTGKCSSVGMTRETFLSAPGNSWGENCPTSPGTSSAAGRATAAPMTLFLATVCLAARLVF